jgi:hypothetical protein
LPTKHLLFSTLLAILIAAPSSALAEGKTPGEVREANAELTASPVNPAPANRGSSNQGSSNQAMIIAPQHPLPDAPAPKRVIDKKFIAVMGALGGAESLRFTTHKLVLDNEFAAGAPWITSVPSNPHLVAKYGGIFAAELLVAYELKKPHDWLPGDRVIRKLWWAPPAVLAIIHIKNGIRNMQTKGPGGCTSVDECEGQQ